MTRAGVAWVGVAVLLAACAIGGWPIGHEAIDWQPTLAWREPWRAFTAVGVHYSGAHLAGNLAGVALAAASGLVAHAPARLPWAWLAAWPLTQIGLLVKPELAHYGGLSGVVHAGIAAVIAFLLLRGTGAQRAVGSVVLIGLCAKLLGESPWGDVLQHPPQWDFAVAPIVHLTGALSGGLCAVIALWAPSRSSSPDDPSRFAASDHPND